MKGNYLQRVVPVVIPYGFLGSRIQDKGIKIQINQLKTQNAKLKHSVVILEQGVSSTDELIDNYKDYYEISYLRNWGLFLTILASWGIMSVIFKPRQILNLNSNVIPKPK